MTLFGEDPRDSQIRWLQQQVEFLTKLLGNVADATAMARTLPRPEPNEPQGKPKGNWRYKEDRPQQTAAEATTAGMEAAAAAERAFRDERQP